MVDQQEQLAQVGKELGASVEATGLTLTERDLVLVAQVAQEGAFKIEVTGTRHLVLGKERSKSNPYRGAGSGPVREALEVETLESITLRPQEGTDLVPLIPNLRVLEIGVEAYDISTTIQSAADQDVVRRILTEAQVQKSVFELLDRGFAPLVLYSGKCLVRGVRSGTIEKEKAKEAIEAAMSLARALPALSPRREGSRTVRRSLAGLAWPTLTVLLVAAAITMFVRWSFFEPWWILGLVLGGAVWGLALPVIAIAVWRRTDPVRSAVRTLAPLLVVLPLLGLDTLLFANCGLDRSAVVERRVSVIGTRVSSGDSKSYYLIVPSWRTASSKREISVPCDFYEQILALPVDKRTVEISWRKGNLGFEWYDGLRIVR